MSPSPFLVIDEMTGAFLRRPGRDRRSPARAARATSRITDKELQMSDTKTTRRLVRKLARTMSDLHLMQTGKKDDGARQAFNALEGIIFSRLDFDVLDDPEVRAAIIATGSMKLISYLKDEEMCGTVLSSENWGRLLKVADPERVSWLLRKNVISRKGAIPALLGRIANGHSEWQKPLMDVAGAPFYYDHSILLTASRGLLTHRDIAPITAAVLRAQVSAHKGSYKELAYNFLGKSDIFGALLIHLAGLPWDELKRGYRQTPVVDALFDEMSSNHGRMQVMSYCRSLEHLLTHADEFEGFRQSLAKRAKVVLPRAV